MLGMVRRKEGQHSPFGHGALLKGSRHSPGQGCQEDRQSLQEETIRRPLSSSFLGLPHRILNVNHKKELLRGLWVYSLKGLQSKGLSTVIEEGFRVY